MEPKSNDKDLQDTDEKTINTESTTKAKTSDLTTPISTEYTSTDNDEKKTLKEIISKLREEKAQLKEREAQLKETADFLQGDYFCCTANVWGIDNVKKNSDLSYDGMYSSEWTNFGREEGYSGPYPYSETPEKLKKYKLANMKGAASIASKGSKRSNASVLNSFAWNIFGGKCIRVAEKVHLLPVSCQEWIGVAGAVLGLKKTSNETNEDFLLKLSMATRGVPQIPSEMAPPAKKTKTENQTIDSGDSKESNDKNVDAENQRSQGENDKNDCAENKSISSTKNARRCKYTGVVHFPQNLIRLDSQDQVLDGNSPLLLVVPVMTLDEAKAWNGEEYKAVILAGLPGELVYVPVSYNEINTKPAETYIGIAANQIDSKLYENLDTMKINKEEEDEMLEIARKSLEGTLLALIGYVNYMAGMNPVDDVVPDEIIEKFRALLGVLRDNKRNVVIPKKKDSQEERKPLLYVTFGTSINKEDYDNHTRGQEKLFPAPDPLLLLAKAAAVWGCMTDARLIANGEDDDDSLSTFDDEVLTSVCADVYSGYDDKIGLIVGPQVTPTQQQSVI